MAGNAGHTTTCGAHVIPADAPGGHYCNKARGHDDKCQSQQAEAQVLQFTNTKGGGAGCE